MAPLAARLPRPSHLTLKSTLEPIIDLTEDEVVVKQEPRQERQEQTSTGMQQLRLRLGGKITTGGPGESSVALKQRPPTTSTVQSKQKDPRTLKQLREERRFRMSFTAKDTVRLGKWPKKLEKGTPVPPPLVQVVTLMNCMGQLVETMTGFTPWDACLVSDQGQIMAESVTLDLDPKFSGPTDL